MLFLCVHIKEPQYLWLLRSQWLFSDHNFNVGRISYTNEFQIHIPSFEHFWIPVIKLQPLSVNALGYPAHLSWTELCHHYPRPLLLIELSNGACHHCVFTCGWNFWAILDSFFLISHDLPQKPVNSYFVISLIWDSSFWLLKSML